MRKYTLEKQIAKFWSKVAITANDELCWEWQAGTTSFGYGCARFKDKMQSAHRVSWELAYGEIENGLFVLHECDNSACVNPKHLFLGTQQNNVDDMLKKNRSVPPRGEMNGRHKLTSSQVIRIRELGEAKQMQQKEIAELMGVSDATVNLILKRKTWKSV